MSDPDINPLLIAFFHTPATQALLARIEELERPHGRVVGELTASDPCPHCHVSPYPGGGPVHELGRVTTMIGMLGGQPVGHSHDPNIWTISYRCTACGASWEVRGKARCMACERSGG